MRVSGVVAHFSICKSDYLFRPLRPRMEMLFGGCGINLVISGTSAIPPAKLWGVGCGNGKNGSTPSFRVCVIRQGPRARVQHIRAASPARKKV
jgi:hypothetical protein